MLGGQKAQSSSREMARAKEAGPAVASPTAVGSAVAKKKKTEKNTVGKMAVGWDRRL